jgi:hypothetical protein
MHNTHIKKKNTNYFLGGSSNTAIKNIKPTSLWAIGALRVFNKKKCIQNEEEK